MLIRPFLKPRPLKPHLSLRHISSIPPNSTVFSLIQPTGKIHLGNYLGAISNWKDISTNAHSSTTIIFGTADLHALTLVRDKAQLETSRRDAIASLISAGISPERCIIYHQSSVPEHTQLQWLLTCNTSMGALNRMTQWKLKSKIGDKSTISDDEIMGKTKAGVFTYPVLQAADILLYKSTHVPVGDDQSQHLELTRDIANTFNGIYGKTFPLPKSLFTPTKKILSLRDPQKKMLKLDPDQNGSIYVTETPDQIAKKIRKATTDSIQGRLYFDPVQRPGVSNLINIISGLLRRSVQQTVDDLVWIKDHKQLKDHVTELIVEEFAPKRHLYEELVNDKAFLEEITRKGTDKARAIASPHMRSIMESVGL